MNRADENKSRNSGNVLFAVFGAVVLVGLLGAGVNSFVKGPLTSSIKQTRTNAAKAQMQIAGQAAVMASATGAITPSEHAKVFITSTTHTGNLGGVTGANSICQARATAAGLSGSYKAWLASSSADSPSVTFTKLNVPYKLVTGTIIASNWTDLTDGTLTNAISYNENGIPTSGSVWSNNTISGTVGAANDDCNNWLDGATGSGRNGTSGNTSSLWTANGNLGCNALLRVYCFQQDTSTTSAANGDCDGDGVVEPLEMRAAGASPAPTGGGLVPAKIGISKKDPWGTEYGYCSWDYGSVSLNTSCQQETPGTNLRLAGHSTNRAAPVVAIVSAGPDRKFTTTCRAFSTADVNSNGVLTDAGDLPLVGKAAIADDDVIFTYTYEQAQNATGGLWTLKSGATSTATIAKKIEAQEGKFAGAGLFAKLAALSADFLDVVSGLRLASPSLVSTCDTANTYALRRNASSNAIEVCNGTTWTTAVTFGGGGGGNPFADVPPTIENKVFVTSLSYAGNLGGVSGADAICQKHANAAALPGKYMAWISDSTTTPATRFNQSIVPYKLVNGTVIANNWADLTDGTIAAPINIYETGETVSGTVRTATNTTTVGGIKNSGGHCSLWTNNDGVSGQQRAGNATFTTSQWTDHGPFACSVGVRLFCFQQTEAATGGGGGSTAGLTDALSDVVTDYPNFQFFGGPGSGSIGGSGYGNLSWGYQNFTASTSATESSAIGAEAAKVVNTGSNVALGYRALLNVTTGSDNSFMGSMAGAGLSSNDYYNIAAGYNAFKGSGLGNIYIGAESGNGGIDNIAFGAEALAANTGNNNTALGFQALLANTTGSDNVVAGAEALRANISGSNNTAVGYQSMRRNLASENTAVGQRSMASNTTGVRNVAVGSEASRYQTGNDNTAIGGVSFKGIDTQSNGSNNTAVGYNTLSVNTTGVDNTAIGYAALQLNGAGSYNVAVGHQALRVNTSGNENTAFGSSSLEALAGGDDNTAFGYSALKTLTSGSGNTAIGYNAGAAITTASSGHTLIGSLAQANAIPAGPTTAIGHYALYDNIGLGNTAVGTYALINLYNGSYNTAVGYTAGGAGGIKNTNNMTAIGSLAAANATGNDLTAIGYEALRYSTGANNTSVGYKAMSAVVSGSNNTAIGDEAGLRMTSASHNTLAGYQAGVNNLTGDFVTAVGYMALVNNLAPANTALGYQALDFNTNGLYNTGIGYWALNKNSIGNFNTAIGSEALSNLDSTYTAASCTGLGAAATATDSRTGHCYYRMTSAQTWVNAQAACETNGDYLTVISTAEEQAVVETISASTALWLGGHSLDVSAQTRWKSGDLAGIQNWQGDSSGSASNNLYTNYHSNHPLGGNNCMYLRPAPQWGSRPCTDTSGYICEREPTYNSSYNTAIGKQALNAATSGNNNTAIGFEALKANTTGSDNTAFGYQALANNTTGSQNTAIGYQAGPSTNSLSNTTSIGNGANTSASNTIRVGNSAITAITGQVAFSAPSDMRLKKDIVPSDLGLDFIMSLKPVSYRLKQGNGRLDYGFLAQDIEASLDGRITNMITRREDEMRTYQLRASDLIAPLVKALQEQDATIIRLQKKIDAIKAARLVKACTKQNAEGRE